MKNHHQRDENNKNLNSTNTTKKHRFVTVTFKTLCFTLEINQMLGNLKIIVKSATQRTGDISKQIR